MTKTSDEDEYLSWVSQLFSISDPLKYLVTFSEELDGWASWLEGYDESYIDDHIRFFKEWHSDKRFINEQTAKRFINEQTAFYVDSDIFELFHETRDWLTAIYRNQTIFSALPPEAFAIVLEALGIFQLFVDKVEDAHRAFQKPLRHIQSALSLKVVSIIHGDKAVSRSKKLNELPLSDYENAFNEITYLMGYIDENRISFRLTELVSSLKVYCEIKSGSPGKIEAIIREIVNEELKNLLESDVVRFIVQALGTKKLKRVEIVRQTGYEEGGHIGGTLSRLKRAKILQHERPHYWVSPEWYDRFGICPDKDGQ